MNHINKMKTSDGTGRDTYIMNDDHARYGVMGMQRAQGQTVIGQWTLRDSMPPMTDEGPPTRATPRACRPSNRRGGKGWLPTIHTEDSRRVDESLRVAMRRDAAQRPSTSGAQAMDKRLDGLMRRIASPRSARSTALASTWAPTSPARQRTGQHFDHLREAHDRTTPFYPDGSLTAR
mmetsp:Transcript_62079/g.173341  ORF Transcript_62079/g.173341 Transcript_62079/m.173341 type:complete len:177 (+) Transcript_62079:121-651(+)